VQRFSHENIQQKKILKFIVRIVGQRSELSSQLKEDVQAFQDY
jgi:hypothetical protein